MCSPCMALGSPTRLKHDFRRALAPSCAVTGTIPSFLKSLRVDQKNLSTQRTNTVVLISVTIKESIMFMPQSSPWCYRSVGQSMPSVRIAQYGLRKLW